MQRDEVLSLLETAVAPADVVTTEQRVAAMQALDALVAARPADVDRELHHFLSRRSYTKAVAYLRGQQPTGSPLDVGRSE